MPFTSRWQGNPAVDCGDVISVETEAGYYSSIVLARKLEYKGGLREEYSAPGMSYTEKNSTGKGSLTQDMEKAKTEIKVLAGEISQKVSKGEMSTEIIQNAESVRIAVEQIGGRNFIKNGAFYFSLSNWTQWGTPSQLGVGPSTVSGYPQRLALTTTGDNQGVYQAVTGLRVGATYTLSALVIVGAENGIPCLMVDNNGELPGVYCENAPKDGFKRYSLAFVAKANTVTVYFGKDTGGAIGWYGVVGIKLEEGPNATEWTPHISEMKSGCFEVTDEHARFTAQDGSYTEFVPGTTGLKWHKAEGDSGKDYFYLMAQGVVVHESGTITDTITLPAEFIGKTVNVIVAVQDMHIDLDIENSVVWYLKVSEGNTFVCTDGTFHVMCMYFGDKLNYVWSAIA
jgi:hypothetical protein